MNEAVVVPDIGDADGVEVIEFCVAAGDTVAVDDALLVIESDKASMEIPSTVAGVVADFKVALGDVVSTGQVVAEVTVADGAGAAGTAAAVSVADSAPTATDSAPTATDSAPTATDSAPPPSAPPLSEAPVPAQQANDSLEVRLPDIGDAGEVVVIELGAAVGERVSAEQMLFVVESDKASMDIVAPAAGVVQQLLVSDGDSVGEDALLAVLSVDVAGGSAATSGSAAASGSTADVEPATAPADTVSRPAPELTGGAPTDTPASDDSEVRAAPVPQRAADGLAPPPTRTVPPARDTIYAGPAVRRMARELGVDLTLVPGTGARGRIVKDDIDGYVKAALAGGSGARATGSGIPAIPVIDFSKFGEIDVVPMSRILKSGATNLHRSWLNVVHVTQHDEADVTALEEFRKSLKPEGERRGTKITPLAFIAKACAYMLAQHPKFNASLDANIENLVMKRYINIGFAVDTPNGLLVPVVRDADKKGVWELAEEINELAAKARDKKLTPGDLQGGTFSISSLGAIGGTGFTPIVNAPEVAILGVAKLATKPVWDGETFVPRKMLPLSLSYDHRAINGAEAGRFVTELSALLADMRRVML